MNPMESVACRYNAHNNGVARNPQNVHVPPSPWQECADSFKGTRLDVTCKLSADSKISIARKLLLSEKLRSGPIRSVFVTSFKKRLLCFFPAAKFQNI